MVRLGAGIVADVVDIRVEDGAVVCVSPKLGGALDHDVRVAPARLRRSRPFGRTRSRRRPAARARRSCTLEKPPARRTRPRSSATSKKAPANWRSRKRRSSLRAGVGSAARNRSTRC